MPAKLRTYTGAGLLSGHRAILRNPIPFFADVLGRCGDFARIDLFPFSFYLVNDPELVREALIEKSEDFIIRGGVSRGLQRLIGGGILTNHSDRWRESRKTLQSLFTADAISRRETTVISLTRESLERWNHVFGTKPFEINREILALSCRITSRTLFQYLPTFDEALEFADAIWVLQSDGMNRYMRGLDLLLLPIQNRVSRACRVLRTLAEKCIQNGAKEPLDEILSVFFAGTESPSNTICWALELLESAPEWREKIVHQQEDALAQVISETLRLFPAGWAFERLAARDTSLGGESIAKGARLVISPFFLHRNVRYWTDPEKFDPTRFSDGMSPPVDIPKYAFLPFGAGPRSCIGARMAWMELRAILGTLVRELRFHREGPAPVPYGSFKIRMTEPLRMSQVSAGAQPRAPLES